MVKGISKQVIVVHAPEPELFEQAIFILKENAAQSGITEQELLRQAKLAVRQEQPGSRNYAVLWALAGASLTGMAWAISLFF